jgi:hypothetical protein
MTYMTKRTIRDNWREEEEEDSECGNTDKLVDNQRNTAGKCEQG